jgi:hypothetical protein
MELFLNLCWLSLLVPACLLWRQRISSDRSGDDSGDGSPRSARGLVGRHLVLLSLGCALVLLFPVISATDDLHAMRPEMEESERAFRHAGHCACALHALIHSSQPALPSSASLTPAFEQVGTVLAFMPLRPGTFVDPEPASRAPPVEHPTSL